MKRLWISFSLLFLICAATIAHSFYLSTFTLGLTDLLTQAEAQCQQDDREQALALTRKAQQLWEDHRTYLHITLRHADIDAVYLYFLQVEGFLKGQEIGEYLAANAALIGQLDLLREQEQLSIENIL